MTQSNSTRVDYTKGYPSDGHCNIIATVIENAYNSFCNGNGQESGTVRYRQNFTVTYNFTFLQGQVKLGGSTYNFVIQLD